MATSIHHGEAFASQKTAQCTRGCTVCRIVSGVGATIDADAMKVAHEGGCVVKVKGEM
jgi:hypothetical protein